MSALAARRARRTARPVPEERTWARKEFRDHVIKPAEVRSYRFGRPNGSSSYWFGLTWTPGHLTLVGDVGEMTLTHYNALNTFEAGIRWAATSDYSYLIEKSDKQDRELDRDGTIDDILRMANEDAVWSRQTQVKDRRRYRRDVRDACSAWERDMAVWHWNREIGADDEDVRPRLTYYLPDHYREEEASTCRFVRKPYSSWRDRYAPGASDEEYEWQVPDGWGTWFKLWRKLQDHYHYCHGDDPGILMTKAGRADMRDILEYVIHDDMHEGEVARACQDLGLDDYYGRYRYKPRTLWQIEAIHHGCNMILDQLDPKRTWGKTWGDPVV